MQHFVVENFAVFDTARQRFGGGNGHDASFSGEVQEIAQQGMAMLAEHGLGMELYSV